MERDRGRQTTGNGFLHPARNVRMPRPHRLDLPGVAQHVVQRGNDRQPCFVTADDYRRYLRDLNEIARREGCAIHAYVLMSNHVHLLVTPPGIGKSVA